MYRVERTKYTEMKRNEMVFMKLYIGQTLLNLASFHLLSLEFIRSACVCVCVCVVPCPRLFLQCHQRQLPFANLFRIYRANIIAT